MTAIEGGISRMQQSLGGWGSGQFYCDDQNPPTFPPLPQGINNDRFPTVTYKTNVLKRGGVGCIYVFK